MKKTGLFVIAGVAVVTLLGLVFIAATFEAPEGGTTTVVLAPPVQPTLTETTAPARGISPSNNSILPEIRIQPQTEPAVAAASDPIIEPPPVEVTIEDPVTEEAPGSATIQLPALNASDAFVFNELSGIPNGTAVISLLAQDQIVRKFVVFVENVSRGEYPQTGVPYKPLGVEMPVRNIDDNLFVMEASAHERFNEIVDTFTSLDTDAAFALYRLLSPLFQQAYAEIGFRDQSFDDTLRSAISNVLRAEEVEGPFQLVKPSVMYLYADASIENLQEVHKLLIRMGPDNTAKIKARLQDFSERL
jgi:hypothetical protein